MTNGEKLLPAHRGQFQQKEYWDGFFNQLQGKSFEWYGEWGDFQQHVRGADREQPCLVVGCGNSKLSAQLAQDGGFGSVCSIDFSEGVIDDMKKEYSSVPQLEFLVMDFLDMEPSWSGKFGSVFDKGSLDALLSDDQDATLEKGRVFLQQVMRVLAPQGVYYCVTLAQDHLLKLLLSQVSGNSNRVVVQPFEPQHGSALLPYLIAVEKGAAKDPSAFYMRSVRLPTSSDLVQAMLEERLVYHMKQRVKDFDNEGMKARFALWNENDDAEKFNHVPRYLISVVDTGIPRERRRLQCAVFIVPQGREHEWEFSSEEGLIRTARSNWIGRMIVVSMGHGHHFESMQLVQTELTPHVLDLAPAFYRAPDATEKLVFVAVPDAIGIENSLGSRKVVAETTSDFSGPINVEEVQVSDSISRKNVLHRRLIFLNNPSAVQSESRLYLPKQPVPKSGNKKKGAKKKKGGGGGGGGSKGKASQVVDPRYLGFEFHQAMVATLFIGAANTPAPPSGPAAMLVVGLGSGALASYLASQLGWLCDSVQVDAVEIDPVVVEIAEKWFGFDPAKVSVALQDGTEFMRACQKRYRAIFLDVDAKDLTQPVLFPPMAFLDQDMLQHVCDNLLEEERGSLVLNLASKSVSAQKDILQRVQTVFPLVVCLPMSCFGDNNCVVVAFKKELGRAPTDAVGQARKLVRQIALDYNDGQLCAAFPHDFDGLLNECMLVSPQGDLQKRD